jgi:hypothetical protein
LRSYLNEKVAAPVLKTEINGRRDPLRWPRDTLYPQKLALTSPTSGGRSVGIVRLRTKGHGVINVSGHNMHDRINIQKQLAAPSICGDAQIFGNYNK